MNNKELLGAFISAIKNFGDRNSFCINDQFYTYTELAQSVSKIRKALQKLAVESGNIGIVTNDDIETYASIYAVWMEGLAYVPLNPMQPVERNQEIIAQANIKIVLSSDNAIVFSDVKTIETQSLVFEEYLLNVKEADAEAIAYILFTSGSTGKPKGVPITFGNLNAFVCAFWKIGIELDENDRCLQCFDLTFDVSVQSFLVALAKGACVYTIPHDQIKYSYVYGLLEEHKLTFGAMAPSMLRYLRPYFDEIDAKSMRYCIVTAEASPLDLIQEWNKICVPNADIYDLYGPTEGTIYCTYYKVPKKSEVKTINGMLSIGKPFPGITTIFINERGEELSIGEKGEMCISGKQITHGYWNNSEMNEKSFFEREYNGKTQRFYHTGDLCYIDDEGDIMYVGRIDSQVKIQGFRVELGEIEFHAREYLKGVNVVCLAVPNSSGNTEVAMFIENNTFDTTDMLNFMKTKLPSYMIPTKLYFESKFPLNVNGKIDKNTLKKLI